MMFPARFSPVCCFSLLFLVAMLSLVPASGLAQLQFAAPGELPAIEGATRAAIIDSLTAVIDSVYVLEEPAKLIVAGLRQNLADGSYDEFTDPAEFARRLYEDAQAISHDGHFHIIAVPPLDPEVRDAQQDEDPADVAREERMERAHNYGFAKAEVLSGGVGYLRFDRFAHGDEAFAAATAAMNFLANCEAVIIDLRANGGGSASMIRYLCGYLFQEETHLINWQIRAEGKTVQSYSADYVPGRRLVDQPVYILTSGRTFSAAEEFTFDLKNHERATVVGETTGGGGHTVAGYFFDFDGFRILIRIPYGRAFNPENNEGWEGTGVSPHIEVPAVQALDTAHADALAKLLENEEDEQYKAVLQWGLTGLENRLHPVELAEEEMGVYVGQYGPRRIYVEGGVLNYQREDRPSYRMVPMGEDLFAVGDLEYFRLQFERDQSGQIVRLTGLYDNGQRDTHERE